MIDFMVIGLPRSGTTWMANWLTGADSYCLHDPLNKLHYEDWDNDNMYIPQDNRYRGVSCTGIWRWPEWVNAHPAKKIVIKRDIDEILCSLRETGLNIDLIGCQQLLESVNAPIVDYEDIFDERTAHNIWRHLIGTGFDSIRYRMLREMHIEPAFAKVEKDINVVNRLHRE